MDPRNDQHSKINAAFLYGDSIHNYTLQCMNFVRAQLQVLSGGNRNSGNILFETKDTTSLEVEFITNGINSLEFGLLWKFWFLNSISSWFISEVTIHSKKYYHSEMKFMHYMIACPYLSDQGAAHTCSYNQCRHLPRKKDTLEPLL